MTIEDRVRDVLLRERATVGLPHVGLAEGWSLAVRGADVIVRWHAADPSLSTDARMDALDACAAALSTNGLAVAWGFDTESLYLAVRAAP